MTRKERDWAAVSEGSVSAAEGEVETRAGGKALTGTGATDKRSLGTTGSSRQAKYDHLPMWAQVGIKGADVFEVPTLEGTFINVTVGLPSPTHCDNYRIRIWFCR